MTAKVLQLMTVSYRRYLQYGLHRIGKSQWKQREKNPPVAVSRNKIIILNRGGVSSQGLIK